MAARARGGSAHGGRRGPDLHRPHEPDGPPDVDGARRGAVTEAGPLLRPVRVRGGPAEPDAERARGAAELIEVVRTYLK